MQFSHFNAMTALPSPKRALLWLLLALPAAGMMFGYLSGNTLAMDLLHPSGEMSVRLMILALLIGPLVDIFGPNKFFRLWMRTRRNLGVAAFAYGALHLLFYVLDMGRLDAILDELAIPSIWTGWLSFFALLAAAVISNDRAVRRLGIWWKRIQRLAYAAFIIGLVHWLLLGWTAGPALVHLGPLLIVWIARAFWGRTKRKPA